MPTQYDKYVDRVLLDFEKSSDELSQALIARLQTFVTVNAAVFNIPKPTSGSLRTWNTEQARAMATTIQAVEDLINETVRGSNYPATLRGLFRNIGDLESFASQGLMQYANYPEQIATALDAVGIGAERELFVQSLTADLNSAFASQVRDPIKQAITYNIRAGSTTKQTTEYLKGLLSKKPGQEYAKIARYSTQIVNDAVLGYDGAIMQRFSDEYGVTEWRYSGSIIADSRPFCVHCVSVLGGVIPDKDLDKLLKKYANSPGMRPGTNRSNFAVKRGGYRCRHRVFPLYISK